MGVRGGKESGAVLKGLLLKWKTSQKHISRTLRELHKKRKRFVFFCAGSAFDAILWLAFMAAGQSRKQGREGTRIALSTAGRQAMLYKLHTKSLTGASPFIGYVLVLPITHFKPLSHQKNTRTASEENKKCAYGRRLPINCC